MDFSWSFAQPHTTTQPSGVSVCTESGRNHLNRGAVRSRQASEKMSRFKSVLIWVKVGRKETRGIRRPVLGERPVSKNRVALLNPFEPKKTARTRGSSRVRNGLGHIPIKVLRVDTVSDSLLKKSRSKTWRVSI